MQAIVSKCYPKDTDATTEYDGIRPNTTVTKATDNDKDNDKDKDYDNEKGVWGKNAREETHPHSHWARDRKIQVLSFLHIFHSQEENSLS